MRTVAELVLLLGLVFIGSSCSVKSNAPEAPMTFNGSSQQLKVTEVVPTLDTPIPPAKNTIWCASFLSAWKALEKDLAQEPVSLEGSPEAAKSLNEATDPRPQIPPEALYVATGWKQQGIVEQIQKDLKQRFPTKEPPTFPGIAENSFVAYSYLEANVRFSRPYCQNRQPLAFTDGQGKTTEINSFGIRPEDSDAYMKLRAQPRVLFRKEEMDTNVDFAIDLCADSSPSQIIVARIARQPTLAAALARVEAEITAMAEQAKRNEPRYAKHLQEIGPNDALLVPDIYWRIAHRFAQLEQRAFNNPKLKGQSLDVAEQDILFRLDKSGAELKSQAWVAAESTAFYYFLDRPFLIYMKKRGADTPYFAMWVDNAELLRPWNETGRSSAIGEPAKP